MLGILFILHIDIKNYIMIYFQIMRSYNIYNLINTDWFYSTIALGIFFIVMFNIMAITTQKLGISISSMASKMSLIIPVIGAVIFQNASIGVYKILGIIIAIIFLCIRIYS